MTELPKRKQAQISPRLLWYVAELTSQFKAPVGFEDTNVFSHDL